MEPAPKPSPAIAPVRREVDAGGGIVLVGDAYGDERAPPVVLLHGGGQTRHAWGTTAAALARAGFYAWSLDQRGHGESTWAPDGDYRLDAYVVDLEAVTAALGRPAALVGASLGGMVSLLAAGEREPSLASAVVLVDVATTAQPAGIARIVEFMRSRPDGFASLEEVADTVAGYLPHRRRPANLDGLARNVRLRDGRYHWHWDPRFLGEAERTATQIAALRPKERLGAAAERVRVPMLLVRGRLSDVISEEDAAELRRVAPHSEYVDVSEAGHMVAGDDNDAFTRAVVDFLQRHLQEIA